MQYLLVTDALEVPKANSQVGVHKQYNKFVIALDTEKEMLSGLREGDPRITGETYLKTLMTHGILLQIV